MYWRVTKTSYYDGLKETIMYMKTDVNKEVKFLFMILKRNLTSTFHDFVL